MKKLLVVLLALGLIVAFGTTASAVDVKFSGQYYVVGVYESNRTLQNTDTTYSRAYAWTRTRIQTVFEIAEGLSFTTRFDAFEKQWGGVNRSSSYTEDKSNSGRINVTGTAANAALQENLEMEYGYVTFKTAIGQFDVGYQAADEWGTGFADTPGSRPRLKFVTTFGPVNLLAIWEKVTEADSNLGVAISGTGSTTATASGLVDADRDNYMLAGIYNWNGGSAGLLYKFSNFAATRVATTNFRTQYHAFLPYMKGTFGPVYVEAEGVYITGKTAKYESPATNADIDKEGYGAYALAKYTIGPAYVGGQFGYSSGNDGTPGGGGATSASSGDGKDKSGPLSSTSWNPTLIFGQANLRSWMYGQEIGGAGGTAQYHNNNKQNLLLYNVFAGINPTPKINLELAFSYMTADKTPLNYVSNKYGYEGDIKATYKIYDNLTYMIGAGYFWTGDFFKGTNNATQLGNDYILQNQLTLNF
jgi:hypothetical protein